MENTFPSPPAAGPVRVLAICPSEALCSALERSAEAFKNIHLTARTGDLEEGLAILRQFRDSGFDAIVSRGGTADLIRKATDIPVISIRFSVYDVLRAIKLAENDPDPCAVVGFPDITHTAHIVSDLLRYDLLIHTVRSAAEAAAALEQLRARGRHTVVCDMVTHTFAIRMGFHAFLIASGEESLYEALTQAESQGRTFQRLRIENQCLKALAEAEGVRTAVYAGDGALLFALPSPLPEGLTQLFGKRLSSVSRKSASAFYHLEHDTLHQVSVLPFSREGDPCVAFRDRVAQIPLKGGHAGIYFLDRTECASLLSETLPVAGGLPDEARNRLRALANSTQPVLISGEPGCGMERAARLLYLDSARSPQPLVEVDCAVLDERSWDFLLTHHASPLAGSGSTVYFQHADQIPPERRNQLISVILESGMIRRERLIFSIAYRENREIPESGREIARRISCVPVHLPSLRSRSDEIPTLAIRYLNAINLKQGKQLTGFDPSALKMLTEYEWPHNITQFQNVLGQLAAQTPSAYISSRLTAEVLSMERRLNRTSSLYTHGNWDREASTLEETAHRAVLQALETAGGNQSAAAAALGISRSTLWRYLKKIENK